MTRPPGQRGLMVVTGFRLTPGTRLAAVNLDWRANILLLRLLDHDDLYRVVR